MLRLPLRAHVWRSFGASACCLRLAARVTLMSMSLPPGCSLFPGFTVHKYCKCLRRAECGIFVYLCRWAQRLFPRNIYLCDSYLQLRLHPISGQNNTRHCHMMPPCLQSRHLSDYCFYFSALDKQWLSLLFLSFCLNPVFLSTFTVLLCLPSISTARIVPTFTFQLIVNSFFVMRPSDPRSYQARGAPCIRSKTFLMHNSSQSKTR